MFLLIAAFLRRHKSFLISHLFTVILTVFTTIAVNRWIHRVDYDVTAPVKDTTVVTVKTDELTPKVVEKIVYVEDKTEVNRLLAENKKLKVKVTQLTESYAQLKSQGTGKIEWVLNSTVPEPLQIPRAEKVTRFKDWRLDFVSDGKDAKYELSQKFEILTTTGRDKDGKAFSRVKLFEIGPKGVKTPATDVKTTVVVAVDETQLRWRFSPSIQAGVGVSADIYKPEQRKPGGIVGVQWLKRGRTKAAEDSTWSLLTPVVFVTESQREIGILPFSFNSGKVPYTPWKDVWLSPYLGTNGDKSLNRIGFAISATF